MNPDAVKLYIANLKDKNEEPASGAKKHKHIWNYNYFVKANGLTWIKPRYKSDLPVPHNSNKRTSGNNHRISANN